MRMLFFPGQHSVEKKLRCKIASTLVSEGREENGQLAMDCPEDRAEHLIMCETTREMLKTKVTRSLRQVSSSLITNEQGL